MNQAPVFAPTPANADPFAGALLPAFEPYLTISAVLFLLSFIVRKGAELSFGGKL